MKPSYSVLTYIFNNYEKVHEVVEKDPEAEYLLVTDDPNLTSETWNVIYDPMPGHSPFGRCYEVRFHPFRYAHTNFVIRVDGSIEIRKSLEPVIDIFRDGSFDRCLMIHPHRNLMADEYDTWIRTRGYPVEQARRCLNMMQRMGYDLTYRGLYQGCFEVQYKNEVNQEINDLTFGLLALLGNGKIERIDQTITSFVLNRFYDHINVLAVSENIVTDGDLMQWYYHNSDKPIKKETTIEPILFNKKYVTWR